MEKGIKKQQQKNTNKTCTNKKPQLFYFIFTNLVAMFSTAVCGSLDMCKERITGTTSVPLSVTLGKSPGMDILSLEGPCP